MAPGQHDLLSEDPLDLLAIGARQRLDAAGSLLTSNDSASTSTVTEQLAGSAGSTVASPRQRVTSMVRS